MRFLIATLLIAGCGFDHGQLGSGEVPDAAYAGGGGGGGGGGMGSGSGNGATSPRLCKYPDPSARLCLEFDDGQFAPSVRDASITPFLDPTATNVQATQRDTSAAAKLATGSLLTVAETGKLDIADAITLELWVKQPTLAAAALIKNDGQYILAVDDTGHVSCNAGGAYVYLSNEPLQADTWTHVACTYDGAQMQVYLDGQSNHCASAQSTIGTGGNQGTVIAGSLVGSIDEVHIYAKAFTTDALCPHTGAGSCKSACSSD